MRKTIQTAYKESQFLKNFQNNCYIKIFFLSRKYARYCTNNHKTWKLFTTRYYACCAIQGKPKRTLRVFGFNRHIIRSPSLKMTYTNLRTVS